MLFESLLLHNLLNLFSLRFLSGRAFIFLSGRFGENGWKAFLISLNFFKIFSSFDFGIPIVSCLHVIVNFLNIFTSGDNNLLCLIEFSLTIWSFFSLLAIFVGAFAKVTLNGFHLRPSLLGLPRILFERNLAVPFSLRFLTLAHQIFQMLL